MKIHQFNPVIYPVKLWVVVTDNNYEIANRFLQYPSRDEINVNGTKDMLAHTQLVEQRDGELYIGVLVIFQKSEYMTVKNIAHESTHAASSMFEKIGEITWGEEAAAYLIGWIAECMEIVKLDKDIN